MLKIILPLAFTLLLPSLYSFSYSWVSTTLILLILSFLSFLFLTPTAISRAFMPLSFHLDSLSSVLIVLSLFISALIIIRSQKILQIKNSPTNFLILITSLAIILILAFATSNLIFFYIAFEASLIPTLFLILGWGYQPERLQARTYLIFYTITASLPLLFSILFLSSVNGHAHIFLPY